MIIVKLPIIITIIYPEKKSKINKIERVGKGNGLIDFQPKNFNINSIKINKRTIPNDNILIDKDENKETLKIRDYVTPPKELF